MIFEALLDLTIARKKSLTSFLIPMFTALGSLVRLPSFRFDGGPDHGMIKKLDMNLCVCVLGFMMKT